MSVNGQTPFSTVANHFARGAYVGFVEWRSPPSASKRKWSWILGFFVGFVVKVAAILYLGAEFIPT